MSKKWLYGKVRWFDRQTGQGMIQSNKGKLYKVHYSAIVSKDKWKILRENNDVKFTPIEDSDFNIVDKIQEVAA